MRYWIDMPGAVFSGGFVCSVLSQIDPDARFVPTKEGCQVVVTQSPKAAHEHAGRKPVVFYPNPGSHDIPQAKGIHHYRPGQEAALRAFLGLNGTSQ